MKKYLLILGLMLAPLSAHAATCSTQSSYKSGVDYTVITTNCSGTAKSNFTAGGSVQSCSSCKSGYAIYSTTMTHSSGCTFTQTGCAATSEYAYIVADCDNVGGSTLYTKVCSGTYGNYLGSSSPSVVQEAGLSTSQYYTCSLSNIKYLSNQLTAKAIICYKNDILIDGEYVSGSTMAQRIGECDPDHRGDDYNTYYVNTDWDGSSHRTVSISNYAKFECCNDSTCMGYADLNGTMVTGLLQRPAKYCLDTGTCSSSISGGYITCDTGYYSTKGKSTYTVTSSGNPNPANYSSYLSCKLCSASDATNHSSATSEIGSDAITDCYLPTGYSETDTTGTWKYASDCHYSN